MHYIATFSLLALACLIINGHCQKFDAELGDAAEWRSREFEDAPSSDVEKASPMGLAVNALN